IGTDPFASGSYPFGHVGFTHRKVYGEDINMSVLSSAEWNGAKVLRINDRDYDGDGIPDFADGYDWGGAGVANDRESANGRFVPVIFSITENLLTNSGVYITLEYDDSPPLEVTTNCVGLYIPAPGKMRYWTKRGGELRSGEPTTSGGSYLTPGTYNTWDFGFRGVTQVTYYVEAVNPGSETEVEAERGSDVWASWKEVFSSVKDMWTLATGGKYVCVNDPVGVISGNTRVDETDIVIPCPLIDLVFRRSYNSHLKRSFYHNYEERLGHLWTHSYDVRLYHEGWDYGVNGDEGTDSI
ncbi:unnamed protein product, partial [marine sediment metagenome]